MKLHLYQILVVVISAIMIYQGVANFLSKKGNQTLLKLFARLLIWGGMALVALYPYLTVTFAKIIGLEGNINAVILTGFIFIFLFIFKLFSAIERLEQQITVLTRNESLNTLKKDATN